MTLHTMRDVIRGVADATSEANPNKVGIKAAIEIIDSGDLDLMKQAAGDVVNPEAVAS